MTHFLLSDLGMFWGRLHPIMVHFPVALIVVMICLLVLVRFDNFAGAKPLVPVILWATFGSCLLAVWMGLSLEQNGQAAGEMLDEHKLQGIIMTVLVGMALLGYYFTEKNRDLYVLTMSILAGLMSFVAGHHGGAITHGETYLSAVSPVNFGGDQVHSAEQAWGIGQSPDSVSVFEGLIHPILKTKCLNCHQTSNKFGGLNLESPDSLLAGGKSGPLWEAGNPHGSRLIQRVSLSQEDSEFMPPSGEPLTYQEMRLMAWWIQEGADESLTMNSIPGDLKSWILEQTGVDLSARPYLETVEVERPSPELLPELEAAGWEIGFLSAGNGLMEVAWSGENQEAAFVEWDNIQSGIAWLDLSGLPGLDALPSPTTMPHLTKLVLKDQLVSKATLQKFLPSAHLESINLVGATLEAGALEILSEFPNLQRVFLWNASFDQSEADQLQARVPDLDINLGFSFSDPQSP